jgi:hypothetical protein
MMKAVLLLTIPSVVFLLLIFIPQVFAQETETELGVQSSIDDMFDAIEDFGEAQTNSSEWFDQEKKDELNRVGESATNTGKTAFQLWWDFHHFIVDLVFAGSPVDFDKGIIVLVSFVIGTLIVVKLFWTFFKRIWKIVLAIIAIIAVILISGIQFPSIT